MIPFPPFSMNSKQLNGQYYTTSNPFVGDVFNAWYALLPNGAILEPFAGSCNLFNYVDREWVGYDIEPNGDGIIQRDTLLNFPTGYDVCITNPPYLAKTVVARRKLPITLIREDLYLDCLEQCLTYCQYVAVIIPSSFLTIKGFKSRLFGIDKIDRKIFDDTDCPVLVAYFTPDRNTKILKGVNGVALDIDHLEPSNVRKAVKFNQAINNYTLIGIDSTKGDNIQVVPYDNTEVKSTNRAIVPFYSNTELDLNHINVVIQQWRDTTKDFYLQSFKSCMNTGKYRKRLSFTQLHYLLTHAFES